MCKCVNTSLCKNVVCIYMVIDLEVLVKSFNCRNRSCYDGNPCESFFVSSQKNSENFAKDGYDCIHYSLLRATTSGLRPPGGLAGEWYRTFTFPVIGSSQASEGEVSPQPNTMVLKHILAPAACIG